MRKDMKKVLAHGGKGYDEDWGRKPWKGELEDAPKRERMRRRHSKCKSFLFSVVGKYLHAQKGRPWNLVWSEICAETDMRSHEGYRLRDTVSWYITEDVEITDTVLYKAQSRWSIRQRYYGLYVHPETGLIEESVRPPYQPKEKPFTEFASGDNVFEKIDGFWYQVWYEKKPSFLAIFGRQTDYVARKRQLGANELRDLNVQNDNQS